MKSAQSAAIVKSCLDRGYIEHEDVLYPPAIAESLGIKPTTKPKKKRGESKLFSDSIDMFCQLVKQELGLTVRMEYRFDLSRKWRFDYAIPDYKIAVEVEGGVWSNGRHTRGSGFMGDMEKYNAAAAADWTLIRRTPKQLLTEETLSLIKSSINFAVLK